jgi:Cu/Ag efflux pump CusA
MIHRLIEICLRNRGLVVVLYLGLAIWGYWALDWSFSSGG